VNFGRLLPRQIVYLSIVRSRLDETEGPGRRGLQQVHVTCHVQSGHAAFSYIVGVVIAFRIVKVV
jgi:hypothetical protein